MNHAHSKIGKYLSIFATKFVAVVISAIVLCGYVGVFSVHAGTTNNFSISNYEVDVYLSKDAESRSVIRVTEAITAQFPGSDQNHGLERNFVKDYDGHPTHFDLESVTNANGQTLNYHWQENNLRIGDADTYVHGEQTYRIQYTQHDVTKHYADTGKDEFYWDVLGTEGQVPIKKATVRIHVADSIAANMQGAPYCYVGLDRSTTRCELVRGGNTSTVHAENLQPREGITVAYGFSPNTFAAYKQSLIERLFNVWQIVQLVVSAVALGLLGWILMRVNKLSSRYDEMKTIVPEYLPPKETSVTTSAALTDTKGSVMSAQLIDLAVRHYIKLSEVKEKTFFSRAQYEIEILKDITDLRWEEQEILTDIFGQKPSVGATFNLKKLQNNTSYFSRTQNNDKDLDKLIKGEYGLKHENQTLKEWLRKVALVLAIAGVVLLAPLMLVVAGVAFVCSFMAFRLSDKGLELKRYIEGLKMYIKVGEQERLRALQSPEGARKVKEIGDMESPKNRVVLYEKLLPYAVLFGNEKEWSVALGKYYDEIGQQPYWYNSHSGAFNAAAFSSGITGIGSAASSASSSSSSSGGSSGGGSAGGGGGGGGSGGW